MRQCRQFERYAERGKLLVDIGAPATGTPQALFETIAQAMLPAYAFDGRCQFAGISSRL